MAETSPDEAARLERRRQHRAANRNKINAQKRAWAAANQDKVRAQGRESYARNREKRQADSREYYRTHREQQSEKNRERYQANRDQVLKRVKTYADARRPEIQEWHRKYYQVNGAKVRWKVLERTHGAGIEIEWFAMWEAQEGRCYLCGRDMDPGDVHVEHWHGCPGHEPKKSCRYCRRGLAHGNCNLTVGHAGDSPELLRIIADNLEAANARIQELQRSAPQHITLF